MAAKNLLKRLTSKEWGSKARKAESRNGKGQENLKKELKKAVADAIEDKRKK